MAGSSPFKKAYSIWSFTVLIILPAALDISFTCPERLGSAFTQSNAASNWSRNSSMFFGCAIGYLSFYCDECPHTLNECWRWILDVVATAEIASDISVMYFKGFTMISLSFNGENLIMRSSGIAWLWNVVRVIVGILILSDTNAIRLSPCSPLDVSLGAIAVAVGSVCGAPSLWVP